MGVITICTFITATINLFLFIVKRSIPSNLWKDKTILIIRSEVAIADLRGKGFKNKIWRKWLGIKRLTEKGRGDEAGYWCFYHWENRIQNSTWWKEGKTLNTDWRKQKLKNKVVGHWRGK